MLPCISLNSISIARENNELIIFSLSYSFLLKTDLNSNQKATNTACISAYTKTDFKKFSSFLWNRKHERIPLIILQL